MNEPNDPRIARMIGPHIPLHRRLPYHWSWPLAVGAAIGIALRLVFHGDPGEWLTAMSASFLFLAPLVVGAATVYTAERRFRRSWSYYIFAPMLANLLFVLGTMAIMIEGLICAILIVPLFSVIGAIGGLAMGAVCRLVRRPRATMYSLAALPLLLAHVEADIPLHERIQSVERTVFIAAPPEVVWRQIHHASDIRADEVGHAWMYRIGVPLPHAGISEEGPDGPVRRITMGKDIHFDQVVVDWEENRRVGWNYRFAADSFPPRALDDHVMIGGHYFDLIDTRYELQPVDGGTLLNIRMGYRVSTRFNWYAEPIARWLIGNFEEVILEFYRRRAEDSGPSSIQMAVVQP